MTAQNTKHADTEIRNSLEEILDMLQSIDENVVEILDAISDQYLHNSYDPSWDCDEYAANHGY